MCIYYTKYRCKVIDKEITIFKEFEACTPVYFDNYWIRVVMKSRLGQTTVITLGIV